MVEHGLLTKYDKIELLDGLMVEKMTKGGPHVMSTYYVGEALRALQLAGFHVKTEAPIALPTGPRGRASVPEPDVSVVRGTARDYPKDEPGPQDVPLVAEVADSSVREDREGLARYAWSKITVAWIVNLVDRCVEVYSEPTGPADPAKYDTVKVYGPDDRIPVVIDGRLVGQVAVKELLP
jgi:Uma2 family endonuclease